MSRVLRRHPESIDVFHHRPRAMTSVLVCEGAGRTEANADIEVQTSLPAGLAQRLSYAAKATPHRSLHNFQDFLQAINDDRRFGFVKLCSRLSASCDADRKCTLRILPFLDVNL